MADKPGVNDDIGGCGKAEDDPESPKDNLTTFGVIKIACIGYSASSRAIVCSVDMVVGDHLITKVDSSGSEYTILEVLAKGGLPVVEHVIGSFVFFINSRAKFLIGTVRNARESTDCGICEDGFQDLKIAR